MSGNGENFRVHSTLEKFQPMRNMVLVKAHRTGGIDVTKSGIILAANELPPTRGTVVAVGPGILEKDGKVHPLQVKPGDEVVYKMYGAHKMIFEIGEEPYWLIKEDDLMLVTKEDEQPTSNIAAERAETQRAYAAGIASYTGQSVEDVSAGTSGDGKTVSQ